MKPMHIRHMTRLCIFVFIAFVMVKTSMAINSSSEVIDAIRSDPAILGWMVGSPPPENRILRFEDGSYFRFPAMRWSISNFRQLMPTVNVSRGLEAAAPLPRALRPDIESLRFTPIGSTE